MDKDEQDFSPTITHIEGIIYEQKFTGAVAGFLNTNITTREIELICRKDNQIDFNRSSDEDLGSIIAELKGGCDE